MACRRLHCIAARKRYRCGGHIARSSDAAPEPDTLWHHYLQPWSLRRQAWLLAPYSSQHLAVSSSSAMLPTVHSGLHCHTRRLSTRCAGVDYLVASIPSFFGPFGGSNVSGAAELNGPDACVRPPGRIDFLHAPLFSYQARAHRAGLWHRCHMTSCTVKLMHRQTDLLAIVV